MPNPRVHRYRVVDVFTKRALEGNALAVFPDAAAIDDATMQRIARELNLAETAFVLPSTRPDCAARVRIFTPLTEMPFAGHPTIGTSFVLLDEGLVQPVDGEFVLEEKIGPIPVRVEPGRLPMLWLATPPITEGPEYPSALCVELLGLEAGDLLGIAPQVLSAGNPTLFVAVRDRTAVDRAWLDLAGSRQLRGSDRAPFLIFVFAPTAEGAYSRMFAPEFGVPEDPATGSSTGPLAAFMMRHGLVSSADGTRFVSEQGTRMGRRSVLHVHIRGDRGSRSIEVGGHVTPLATASMSLVEDSVVS
jgi:trans-2,3-dihydro-3-hydroxyanthranilate isomerase